MGGGGGGQEDKGRDQKWLSVPCQCVAVVIGYRRRRGA